MFVAEGRSNYDAVLEGLLARIGREKTGVRLFGEEAAKRDDGFYVGDKRLDTMGSILAARYLLGEGSAEVRGVWVPYRDFKDGARFAVYIKANIEDRIARAFEGKRALLEERLRRLGAKADSQGVNADLSMVLEPLPHIPLLLRFWDRDEEFPACFRFLFDASATAHLDLESLAVLLEYICLKVTGEA